MALVHQTKVTASVDGTQLGTFQYKSGGEVDIDEVKNRPGDMHHQVALGGPRMVSNVIVRRMYDKHMKGLAQSLSDKAGRANMTVIVQSLDEDKNVLGAVVYTGILKRVAFPDADSNAADTALLELELSADGDISAK